MQTILVTGANGFVGGRIVDRLLADGYSVRALTRRPGTVRDTDREALTEVVGDFTDPSDAQRALDGADAVVHAAAGISGDLDADRAVNKDGTATLARAALAGRVERFVHVSTASVYKRGPERGDLTEDAPKADESDGVYSLTKWEAEQEIASAVEDGLKAVILRPPAILGYGESSTWGHRLPESVKAGKPLMVAPAAQSYAFVHVDDFAEAVVLALTQPGAAGHVYDVCTGTVTWKQFLGDLSDWFGVDHPEHPDDDAWTGTIPSEAIRRELGWEPQVSYDQGMEESRKHWVDD